MNNFSGLQITGAFLAQLMILLSGKESAFHGKMKAPSDQRTVS